MEIRKFKTNLKCNGCISAITPALNSIEGITSWNVDLSVTDRLLVVESDKDVAAEVLSGVKKAGYEIEQLG